ncbi:MAG: hypothetical protein ACOYNI_02860 [Acidimicrobiia bacterium]
MTAGPPLIHGEEADITQPYRRRIRCVAPEPGVVIGDLEDDFHRFRVTLRHANGVVTAVDGEALRFPWTTCPGAVEPLRALEGMPIDARCTSVSRIADPKVNCTHMFDLAGHSVAHAARGTAARQYDVELWRTEHGHRASIARDHEPLFEWEMQFVNGGRELVDPPPPFDTAPVRQGGFIRWTDEHLESELGEAAVILRRACDIGMGRGMAFDQYATLADIPTARMGICFSWNEDTAPVAVRMQRSVRDFGTSPDALCTPD